MKRTRNFILTTAIVLLATLASTQAAAPVKAVEGVSITVSDLERSVDFYSTVLSFRKISEAEHAGADYEHLEGLFGLRVRTAKMQLGDESIELAQYLSPSGRRVPDDLRSNDRSFQHIAIVVSDMQRAYEILRAHKVQFASSGPQRLPDWNPNAGGIQAFYFKDPDGHPLELLEFPADKGAAKWHGRKGALFLGIDHTAIVVGDTDASLHFYRDLLGLRVAGNSENYGTEQEHLNNVFGARLRITALRSAEGPGIELLEYLAPRDGRAFPTDERASDILHRETVLEAANVNALEKELARAHVTLISPGAVHGDFGDAVTVRDPDGHVVRIQKFNEGVQ